MQFASSATHLFVPDCVVFGEECVLVLQDGKAPLEVKIAITAEVDVGEGKSFTSLSRHK